MDFKQLLKKIFVYDNREHVAEFKKLTEQYEKLEEDMKCEGIHPISTLTYKGVFWGTMFFLLSYLLMEVISTIAMAIVFAPTVGLDTIAVAMGQSFLIALIPALLIAIVLTSIIGKVLPHIAMKDCIAYLKKLVNY